MRSRPVKRTNWGMWIGVLLNSMAGFAPAAEPAGKPNIVYILADDLGFGDPHCNNPNSKIPTPNMDRMAVEGMRFTDAHTPSAVCTPTRYGIMTGRYCWRTILKSGVLDGVDPPLIEPTRMTVASLLKQNGYATACFGKWHLGMQWTGTDGKPYPYRGAGNGGFRGGEEVDFTKPNTGGPVDVGFDTYYGISASLDMAPYAFIENNHTAGVPKLKIETNRDLFFNVSAGVQAEGFKHVDVLPTITRKTVEYIERQTAAIPAGADTARKRTPFFIYMPLSAPHLPIVPTDDVSGKSKAGKYGDFVVEVDQTIGAVLDALERGKIADNTLVVITSDNGGLWHWWDYKEADDVAGGKITPRGSYVKQFGHQSNADLRGTKSDIWEGGHRVPFIVRWPGRVKAGSISNDLVELNDWLATCADIVGAKLPDNAGEDSFSILPVLAGTFHGKPVRKFAVLHSGNGVFGLREGNWLYVPSRGSGGFSTPKTIKPATGSATGQLYDLAVDPAQTKNVWVDHADVVTEMSKHLELYQKAGRTR